MREKEIPSPQTAPDKKFPRLFRIEREGGGVSRLRDSKCEKEIPSPRPSKKPLLSTKTREVSLCSVEKEMLM
jgi:hypothetical protein